MDVLRQQQISHYFTVAAITALAYDIVISLGEEITHIWRPVPFFAGFILIVPVVSLIFFLRVAALYGFERKMNIFLTILFLGECTCELATTIRLGLADIPGALSASDLEPGLTGCSSIVANARGIDMFQILAWIPLLCGSSITFFLTLLKFWRTSSSESAGYREKIEFLPPLMTTFYKDGIVFFFLIFWSLIAHPYVRRQCDQYYRRVRLNVFPPVVYPDILVLGITSNNKPPALLGGQSKRSLNSLISDDIQFFQVYNLEPASPKCLKLSRQMM